MVCRVTSTDAKHGFRLVSDYITDPARDSVVVQTTLQPLGASTASALDRLRGLKVYVRYDATIDNSGGGLTVARWSGPGQSTFSATIVSFRNDRMVAFGVNGQ